jgi:hypothetical protein
MKKYKHTKLEDITCMDSKCDLKFNMSSVELDFANNPFKLKDVEIEASFESPEPIITSSELTQDQWRELLAIGCVFVEDTKEHGSPV